MSLPTCVKVTRLIYSPKQQVPISSTCLSSPLKRTKRHLENIPMIWNRNQSSFPHLPPFLTTFPRYENIFITSNHCQVNWLTRSFKIYSLSLSAGWEFISYQSKSRTSIKIFTHSPNLDIFSFWSAVGLERNQLGMCDPVSCEYTT